MLTAGRREWQILRLFCVFSYSVGRNDTEFSSTRFIIFDQNAKIVAEHQTEFPQILPHAGWHEQDPQDLVDAMVECINKAVEKLEWMGWKKDSIKGIGKSSFCACE